MNRERRERRFADRPKKAMSCGSVTWLFYVVICNCAEHGMKVRVPVHDSNVQGMIAIWILLTVLGGLCGLLFVPLLVRAELRLTLQGGACTLTLRYLFLRHMFSFRIHLLEEPMLSLEYLHPDGRIKRIRKKQRTKKDRVNPLTILHRVRFRTLRIRWQIGVANAPAMTAILTGILQTATAEAAAFFFRDRGQEAANVLVEPVFERNVCFFSLSGIATALPAHIIREILWKKRQK